VRRWLGHGFTGCGFASAFANKEALLFAVFDEPAVSEHVDAVYDLAADHHLPAIVVFPIIRDEQSLVAQLQLLAKGERWTVSTVSVDGLQTTDTLVGMTWKTSAGLVSTPMGFAPFPTMPVTRRAPYVCLATWPGGHENPHRKRPRPGFVDFLDAALPAPLSVEEYKAVRRTSEENNRAARRAGRAFGALPRRDLPAGTGPRRQRPLSSPPCTATRGRAGCGRVRHLRRYGIEEDRWGERAESLISRGA
jgi:hypothetical protein